MHELAALTDDSPRPNVVVLQDPAKVTRKKATTIMLIRCPECGGLRSVPARRFRSAGRCFECRHGKVVRRETFCAWWEERFTMEVIEKMAEAIWE